MNMRVYAAGGEDLAFPGDDFGAGADDDIYAGLNIGVAGFAYAGNPALFDADISLNNAPVINNQRIGNHQIHRLR